MTMMTSSQLQNPGLFTRLLLFFGADAVEVVRPGQPIDWCLVEGTDGRPERKVIVAGEEFLLRCKVCVDHRARLYINHRWGVYDKETSSRNLWLINCYNENCYSDFDRCLWLYEAIMSLPLSQLRAMHRESSRIVTYAKDSSRQSDTLSEVPNPGPLISLHEMARRYPGHRAVTYLEDRGFDPAFIGRYWGAGYCPLSRYRWVGDRIVIPIRQHGMQVGWQARYIGDDVDGQAFNEAHVPKYWTCPSMPKRLVAYNIERALKHPTLVIVEGVTDVWRVGPMATALLGVSMSHDVQSMIVQGMRAHGDRGVVIVALDPQPPRRVNPRPAPHPIDRITAQLSALLPGRVVPLWLPQQYDAGNIDRQLFIQLAREQAAICGLAPKFDRQPPDAST